MESTSHMTKRVELVLLGIDKVWVRSNSGDWIEKQDSPAESSESTIQTFIEEESSSGKWWMFWKR